MRANALRLLTLCTVLASIAVVVPVIGVLTDADISWIRNAMSAEDDAILYMPSGRWERLGDLGLDHVLTVMAILLLVGLQVVGPLRSIVIWTATSVVGVVLIVQTCAIATTMPLRSFADDGFWQIGLLAAYIALAVAVWRGFDRSAVARPRWRRRKRPGKRIGIGILREGE